ncbi:MAG: hypothetical protein IKQ11_02425 [Paludibacteraceae bacterium]|nr:hypothetical protein [Paludibacteraceae bacterium]
MKKLFFTLFVFTSFALGAEAQEMNAQEVNDLAAETAANTEVARDSIAVDTIVADPDPEWYVAPISYDSVVARFKAPRRAAAANCPIDSVRTFNVDSVLESVTVYEYGDTTRTMIWTVNPDGSRYGSGREESASTASSTYSATYAWDFTTNDWAGVSREEHYFVAGKDTAWLVYAWVNNAWVVNTKYTYVFDGSGRETEFTTYERNAAGQLAYSKQRIREYNAAGKTTLDIQYTAHNGSDWSAGTKRIYDYDGNNTILNEYYSAYTNGAWVGSSKEILVYTAGKKTYYEKDTWSNGAWVKNTKETWEFNAAGKETLYEKYSVNNNDWAITNQNNSGYNEYNNLTYVENYTFNKTTGVKTGAKKEDYTLKGNTTLQLEKIQYKWVAASAEWVNNIKTVKAYNDANKTIDNCTYNWLNDEWTGVYTRTKTTYSGNNVTEVLNMSWSADLKDWVNSSRTETEYTGSNKTKETNSKWQDKAWLFTGRTDYHYTAGKNDTTTKYTSDGVTWTPTDRTVNTFNAAGTNIMTHIATWQNDKWTLKSMTRTDLVDHVVDGQRQTLSASWKCGSDSVWIGQKKDTTLYSTTGKTLYTASYKGWKDNDWIPTSKSEFYYDEQDRAVDEQSFKWSNGWVGNIRNEYGYDEQGRRNMIATYVGWSSTTNWWIGSNKTYYSFDAKGNTDYYIIYNWGGSDWVYSTRQSFTYDGSGKEIGQVIEQYINKEWVNKTKYEKEYKGGNQTKNNEYTWLNNEWVFRTRNESYYDEDAQAKLRHEIIGSWNNGILQSFADNYYCYACDPKLAFTIRFENENGVLLESQEVKNGAMPVYGGEKPTKENTAQYTYSFKGWDKAIVAATGDATYIATFDSIVNAYLITFKNGEEVLQSEAVAYGKVPTYDGEKPAKQSNAQYTYSFKGWDAELVVVTGEATYSATFDSIVNTYLITFKNGDETLQSTEVEYGTTPSYTGGTPTKPATAEYTYTFTGWDAELVAVTGEATYSATFSSTLNKYLITFKNGEDVLQSTEVEYGTTPSYTGGTPTKPATAEYTYTFTGWDAELVAVTGEATYSATFSSTKNQYTITWLNDDDSQIDQTQVEYGIVPTHDDPTKQSTAEYTYTFTGWDKTVVAVTGDATYKATFSASKNQYTVTWLYDDGSQIDQTTVEYGVIPTHDDPTKPATAEYTFTFTGWDKEITAVTGEATYTAVFDSVVNTYTIIFYYEDGVTEMERVTVEYGQIPATTVIPSIQGDEHYTYEFAGWSPEIQPVTGEATYTATFTATPRTYAITFKNYNGVLLQTIQVAYGEVPVYSGETPSKPTTAKYTYVFSGWDKEITAVTGDATYTAVFESIINTYTVIFYDEDGTELDRVEVEYGKMPTYTGETPTKADDEEYTYTFVGWTPKLKTVTGDAAYTATYTAAPKGQGLDQINDQSSATKVMINGTIYILRAGKTYTVDGVLVE